MWEDVLGRMGDLTRAHGEVIGRLDSGSQEWLRGGPHVEGTRNTMHGVVRGPFAEQIGGGPSLVLGDSTTQGLVEKRNLHAKSRTVG